MPYEPHVNNLPATLLYAGINSAGEGLSRGLQSLGESLGRHREAMKKEIDSARAADTFFKVNPEVLAELGVSPEQWQRQSARDKVAAFTGIYQAQGYKKAKQDAAMEAERQQMLRAQEERLRRQEEEAQSEGEAARRFATTYNQEKPTPDAAASPAPSPIGATSDPDLPLPPYQPNAEISEGQDTPDPDISGGQDTPTPAPPLSALNPPANIGASLSDMGLLPNQGNLGASAAGRPLSTLNPQLSTPPQPDRFRAALAAALQTPGLKGRSVPKLIEAFARLQQLQAGAAPGDLNPRFSEDPISGQRFAVYNKTMASSGTNPSLTVPGAVPQYDQDTGELVGHSVPIGGGKFAFRSLQRPVPNKIPDALNKTMDSIGEDIARYQDVPSMTDAELKARNPGVDPAVQRAGAKRSLATAQTRARMVIDRYHTTGTLSPEQRDQLYQEVGLTPAPTPAAAPKAPPVGTVLRGYKYNGKFAPGDQRAWDKVP